MHASKNSTIIEVTVTLCVQTKSQTPDQLSHLIRKNCLRAIGAGLLTDNHTGEVEKFNVRVESFPPKDLKFGGTD